MFKEDQEAIALAQRETTVPSAKYDGQITGVEKKAGREGNADQWIIKVSIVGTDYEGMEFPMWISHARTAGGAKLRNRFYNVIGYCIPEDGAVDETEFIGRFIEVDLDNQNGQVRVKNWNQSKLAVESIDDDSAPGQFE